MEFIAVCLSVFGLAASISVTFQLEGPFELFWKLREWARAQDNWIKRGIWCPICLSFWIGIPIAAIAALDVRSFVVYWLGSFGFTAVMTVVINRLRGK